MMKEEKIFDGRLFDACIKELRDNKHKVHELCRNFNLVVMYDGRIYIDDNVIFGPNISLIGSVHIGESAVIGTGNVATIDIPARYVVFGHPAT